MRFAYTDGTVHYEPDMCACGKMDTSGYCSYCCPFRIRLRMIGSMLVVEERYCSHGRDVVREKMSDGNYGEE